MTTQFQIEIMIRQTDSTAKKNRPVVTKRFISSDTKGTARFFSTPRRAMAAALGKLFEDNIMSSDILGFDCLMWDQHEWHKKLQMWIDELGEVDDNGTPVSESGSIQQVRHKAIPAV